MLYHNFILFCDWCYSPIHMYHILLVHLSLGGNLISFTILAIKSDSTVNSQVQFDLTWLVKEATAMHQSRYGIWGLDKVNAIGWRLRMFEDKAHIYNWGVCLASFLNSTETSFGENNVFLVVCCLWGCLVQISPFVNINQGHYKLLVIFHRAWSQKIYTWSLFLCILSFYFIILCVWVCCGIIL